MSTWFRCKSFHLKMCDFCTSLFAMESDNKEENYLRRRMEDNHRIFVSKSNFVNWMYIQILNVSTQTAFYLYCYCLMTFPFSISLDFYPPIWNKSLKLVLLLTPNTSNIFQNCLLNLHLLKAKKLKLCNYMNSIIFYYHI